MHYRVFLSFFFFLGTALTGCGNQKSPDAPGLGSGSLRWDSFPVSIRADSALLDGGAAESDLRAALSFWETRAGKPLFQLSAWPSGQAPVAGSVTNPQALLDNVIFFQNPWPNSGEWGSQIAGKTVVTSTGGSIDHAVVFLNGEMQLCAADCDDGSGPGRTSRQRLIAHELGHFLGFAHVPDMANIMYPTIQPGGSLDDEVVDTNLLQRLTQ